jgi:hypothetical protein
MTRDDLALEDQIELAYAELLGATSPDERGVAWERMKQLHECRRAERVAEMEQAQGLRG